MDSGNGGSDSRGSNLYHVIYTSDIYANIYETASLCDLLSHRSQLDNVHPCSQ